MKFGLSNLKSVFGSKENAAKTEDAVDTDAIIDDIATAPFAISENNVLYAGLNDLGGYHFFQTIVVGSFRIKTKKGATLTVVGKNFEMELQVDMEEFESEPTNVANRYATKIDFQIEESHTLQLVKPQLEQLILKCKKHTLVFTIIEGEEE